MGLKILHLPHSKIDKLKWNQTVSQASNYLPYAYSWYLDVVSPGWNAMVTEDYSFIFPLTHRKKIGFTYLYQPMFTQQLGLFSKYPIEEKYVLTFLQSIPATYKFIEINLNEANTFDLSEELAERKRNMLLDLNKDYDTLRKAYGQNHTRNLRKAEKGLIKIVKEPSPALVIEMFKKTKGKEVKAFANSDYETFYKLCEEFEKRKCCEILVAEKDRQPVAGAVFLITPYRIIFLFSGTLTEALNTGAMHLIIDTMIKKYAGKNLVLDFEGSNTQSLAYFYKSFGAAEHVYLHIKRNNLPYLLKLIKK